MLSMDSSLIAALCVHIQVMGSVWCVIHMCALARWCVSVTSATTGRTRVAAPSVGGQESLTPTTARNVPSVRRM